MRNKEVYPFPFCLIYFSVSGYFWPAPDTGNWPVQLKHLQMTLSLALIHTQVLGSISPVKYISLFIGCFLSLLSQGSCCFANVSEGERKGTEQSVGKWGIADKNRRGGLEKNGVF